MQELRRGQEPRLLRRWTIGAGLTGSLVAVACAAPLQSVGYTPVDPDLTPESFDETEPPAEGTGSAAKEAETPGDESEEFERDGIQEEPAPQGCDGQTPASLRALVAKRSQEAADCLAGISVQGRVELRYSLRVEADGSVSALTVLTDTLHSPTTQECVEAVLQVPFEEGPQDDCVFFVVPLEAIEESFVNEEEREEDWQPKDAEEVLPADDQ